METKEGLLRKLIGALLRERHERVAGALPEDADALFRIYRGLVNIRPAGEARAEYLRAEDTLLQMLINEKGIHDASLLPQVQRGISLWQGDITTLRCGAIVNAANSGLTGCWSPCHSCIDNAIHTFAGVRLRLECDRMMQAQGHEEPTGLAKLTGAYNLPAEHVLHTVGPIVDGRLTESHCALLRSCYESCMSLAAENGIESVAFCCISTGVFGFPQREAAEIAVKTVRAFLKTHGGLHVIFNVFRDDDLEIYRSVLAQK